MGLAFAPFVEVGAFQVDNKAELVRAIDELEEILRQSAELADASDVSRRRAVELRRQIAGRIGMISTLGELAFEDSEEQRQFKSRLSALRSAMAHHQASWPIVSINADDPEYLKSLRASREAHRGFILWVRSTVGTP